MCMAWGWDDGLKRLEPMWSVMNDQTVNTKDSVQVCSILHVAHVGVRRVALVLVHIGLEGVLVVIHFLRSHFVRELLYQEVFSLHPPSVTVDCVDCYPYNHDKILCIKFLQRFMPQMNSWFTEYTGFPVRSVFNTSLWWSLIMGMPPGSLPLPPWGGTLWPIFIVRLVLRFLEAMQSRQCFLEVRLTSCRHLIEIHHIWSNPPITTIDFNFFLCGNMTVVFACKPIHFKDDLFRATQLNHRLSEELITDKSIVNVFVLFLSTPSLKLICRVVFFATCFLSRTCDRVVGPSWCRSSGWRTDPARMRCTSCFLLYHLPWGVHMSSIQCQRSSTSGMLCTVILAPRRLSRIVQCS